MLDWLTLSLHQYFHKSSQDKALDKLNLSTSMHYCNLQSNVILEIKCVSAVISGETFFLLIIMY